MVVANVDVVDYVWMNRCGSEKPKQHRKPKQLTKLSDQSPSAFVAAIKGVDAVAFGTGLPSTIAPVD